ncbi:minor tail protein [Gordonia phage Evaa]|nr:minor tail protein [Gordonia phage Evaa]
MVERLISYDDEKASGTRLPPLVVAELSTLFLSLDGTDIPPFLQDALDDKADASALTTKADLVNGKLAISQLPDLAIGEFLGAVGSEAAMLALVGQRGDWCTRTDTGTDWRVIAEPTSSLASWRQQTYPSDAVSSVAGLTGAVTAGNLRSALAINNVDNTSDAAKPVSTAQADALAGKVDKSTETNKAYGTNSSGGPIMWSISSSGTSTTLALRGSGGTLNVGTATLDTHAVTKAQLDSAVASGVADGGVTTVKIADGAVTLAKFANEVGPKMSEIANTEVAAYVTNVLLPIETAEIADGAVENAKIANGAVNSSKIADNSIVNADIASNAAIALSKLATGRVAGSVNGTATTTTVWRGTEAQYAQLATKDANTIYFRTA